MINVYTLEGTGFFGAAELAFGGKVYHSGIEIDGAEYAFGGGTTARRATGVWSQPPRKPPFPNSQFVTSLDMGESAPVSLSELIPAVAHDPAWRQPSCGCVCFGKSEAMNRIREGRPCARPFGKKQTPPIMMCICVPTCNFT